MQQVQYKAPKRLNWVSGLMLLGVAAGAYWMWLFFPHYFDAWSVDHILQAGATSVYRANKLAEPQRTQEFQVIVDDARNKIVKQVGIRDPELTVNLNIEEQDATMTADYHITVSHPMVDYRSHLHFHRVKGSNIKAVNWE